ncbi:prion-like-(Q/N-rich) domain-bearing protein 25 [Cotesia typhae]|uniref:prion-like-(Q/N-rich) domain-bearing protein 25 n=1 Tax=Cotesia typhae TaxID=2053667 RepID=UPI003D69683F
MPCTYDRDCHHHIPFSKCSTKNKCTCIDHYHLSDNRCVLGFAILCSRTIPCSNPNFACVNDMCQCQANYTLWNSRCLSTKLGFSCQKDEDCFLIPHSKCTFWQCVCEEGYTRQNADCAPLLGSFCSTNDVCAVDNSVCIDDICQCDINYEEQSNDYCMLGSLGAKCRYNRDCHSILNSQCSSSSICTCKFRHVAMNEFSCVPIVGGYCTGDLNCDSRTMECVANKCRCKPNFTEMSATLCIETTNVYSCIEPSECSDSWHLTCSPNKKCVCQTNNTAINHATCLPTLGGLCWKDDQCAAKKSSCVDYRCACKEGYIRAADNFCVTAD